jgi:ABC-type dipeptide/oligopeptide/nickel transport system permease component
MHHFILRRLIYVVITMMGTTILVFAFSRMVGDPRLLYAQEGGYGITPEQWEALGREMGLDKPVIVQYFMWLGRAVRGDLGESLLDRKPVAAVLGERIGNTLQLALGAWLFATLTGVPLGVLSAVKRATIWDYLGRGFALLGQTLPVFWIGIMGILIFSVKLGWLPTGTKPDYISIKHFIMPCITLGWFSAAGYMRLTRSAMLEVLDAEYIKLARAKGVGANTILWKHAFKNAVIPPLTFSGLIMAAFITGAVVTESVFAWPGMGRLAFQAVVNNDFPVMTGVVLVFTAGFLLVNLLINISYAYLGPRIRYQ